MDILAAMFAYLVCVAGVVTGLAMSFIVFFSAPHALMPQHAVALAEKPGIVKVASAVAAAPAPVAKAAPSPAVAADARQKPSVSSRRSRRMADKQRTRHLAYRERSSFESRFLHFDD